jgi:hypothetical protein
MNSDAMSAAAHSVIARTAPGIGERAGSAAVPERVCSLIIALEMMKRQKRCRTTLAARLSRRRC